MRLRLVLVLALALLAGCKAGGCAANVLGDIVGATGDAHCDRRFVGPGKEAAPFCQEIIDTIALSEFQDDCREKHDAISGEGRCASEDRLGGCKLHKVNDDGSEVWDWYYDTTPLEEDTDGGVGILFKEPIRTKEDVQKLCADPKRYEEGASFVEP